MGSLLRERELAERIIRLMPSLISVTLKSANLGDSKRFVSSTWAATGAGNHPQILLTRLKFNKKTQRVAGQLETGSGPVL